MKKTLVVLSALIVLLGGLVLYSLSLVKKTAQAYVYSYPLALMALTRDTMLGSGFTLNRFSHIQSFPDHTFRNVVRPNNDTLYSIAWLDLSTGPLVLDVPDTAGRQYVMPLMDMWTNVFATVGKGSTGTGAGSYLIAGPDWQGTVPADVQEIAAPTHGVWIIGRIQTNGRSDIPNVRELQREVFLTPLASWLTGERDNGQVMEANAKTGKRDPAAELMAMSATEYFALVHKLLQKQWTLAQDDVAVTSLRTLGIVPGSNEAKEHWNPLQTLLMDRAIKIAQSRVLSAVNGPRELENGWAVWRSKLGRYGDDYGLRMAVAVIGLGALPPEEAAYPNAEVDVEGNPLLGANRYRLHFPAGQTPPVDAFWSLTMYDEDGFLVDNPINRYTIGDRDSLQYNEDGSLDIFIQFGPPENQANWLPAPDGTFAVTMRLYLPGDEFLSGEWQVPGLQRVR
ncbi:DUF1254 domain-containing protein [Microbulbifer agarilyticus]|uniref:DUF1254 domain-containing protein n=1 Tax=Microbulbifer agarilyticus TaxID=260552 RepID=UPI001CD312EC|nr:DUF1254 domain-containing protein [Microbulbifer agarilyticus]MCA0893266.1 DUF1254 domain-containing protein [Microbulbifer agarilyticus]